MSADAALAIAPLDAAAAFVAFLDAQRADFRRGLPARISQIRALWGALARGNESLGTLVDLERQAHNLAGTGATFGLRQLGVDARALELLLHDARQWGGPLGDEQKAQVAIAILTLERSP